MEPVDDLDNVSAEHLRGIVRQLRVAARNNNNLAMERQKQFEECLKERNDLQEKLGLV